jgi:hypothetical protein
MVGSRIDHELQVIESPGAAFRETNDYPGDVLGCMSAVFAPNPSQGLVGCSGSNPTQYRGLPELLDR